MKTILKSIPLGILCASLPTMAQQEGDPFASPPKTEGTIEVLATQWEVTCEIFSLPLSQAARLKRARWDEAKSYQEIVKWVKGGKATQEEFLIVRTLNGTSASAEEITERIYPTEFEPPELPSEIGNLPQDLEKAKNMVTPATPSAFDTKNEGSTLEVEVTRPHQGIPEVKLSLSLIKLLGRQKWGQGVAEVEMPRFASQNIRTSFKASPGQPTLVGTIPPPEALQPKEAEKQVWLAFVTVSEAKD